MGVTKELERYFPPPTTDCPTFYFDSEWTAIVDAADYFSQLDELLTGLGVGDSVHISGLDVDPAVALRPGGAAPVPLGERLARAAADGAQVRVLIAGKVAARAIPLPSLGGFRDGVRHADRLRSWRPAAAEPSEPGRSAVGVAPLQRSVLVDYAGPLLGSNHQKVAVVQRNGELTAFVGGIDLVADRLDHFPHDRMRLAGERWGWHDAVVRLKGPAAARVYTLLVQRWGEAAELGARWFAGWRPFRLGRLNPPRPAPPLAPVVEQAPRSESDVAVRVMRSVPAVKVGSVLPGRRRTWSRLPSDGLREIHATLVPAIAAARRYIYLEDQYLREYAGGDRKYELYGPLREAARRGVKVILVGSGVRDPEDPGLNLGRINRSLNSDLERKLVRRLSAADQRHVSAHRVEYLTVHAKLVLIDDVFACIGSANMFSRSMGGTDSEISTAVTSGGSTVRDLRVRVWAEHLRAPLNAQLRASLEDLELALGIWREEWLPAGAPPLTWRLTEHPVGFGPVESMLRRIWPPS